MKKLLTSLLLLFAFIFEVKGQTYYITGDISYGIRSNYAYVNAYRGSGESIEIPPSIVYNDKQLSVTDMKGFIYSNNNETLEKVYIPASIQQISGPLFRISKNKIRSIVFANDNFTISEKPIQIETTGSLFSVIIIGGSTKSADDLANDNNRKCLLKTGEITIGFATGNSLPVQLYLYKSTSSTNWEFDQIRLNDLLDALNKNNYNLQDISYIDLSNLSTAKGTVSYGDMSLPSECINALLITDKNTIIDKIDFEAPTTDYTGPIYYLRKNTKGWNTVCLPFNINESDFPQDTKIYKMSGGSESEINLSRLGGETLQAGTPCLIYCEESSEWNISIANGTILSNVAPIDVTPNGSLWTLKGRFTNLNLGEGYYKLNSTGTAFVRTTSNSTVVPFRCYLEPGSNHAPARLEVSLDDEAEITLVPDDAEPQTVKLYDLMGRPRQGNASGFFIRSQR